jgi:guanosine-3',5'-bis(diphosphate) 3'-pyrophosphohydrolase
VIDLPEGSSCIDFAYAIHTDVGNHTQSAKVNGKMVSLEHTLKRGDVVEVTVNKNQKPSSKWLPFCKTSFARKQIERFLGR